MQAEQNIFMYFSFSASVMRGKTRSDPTKSSFTSLTCWSICPVIAGMFDVLCVAAVRGYIREELERSPECESGRKRKWVEDQRVREQ
jgi:hypothetical protein